MNSSVAPVPVRQASPLWSLRVGGAVRGISLAREAGCLLVRDDQHWLYLLNRAGAVQGQLQAPKELTTSASSDEGTSFVVGSKEGDLWWLAPDLMPRWQCNLGKRIEGIALDPLGHYVAACDSGGDVYLITRKGQVVWKTQSPRPLRFLTFLAEQPFLIGSADYGLVICLDEKGKMVWRDGLVAHVGSLAASADGAAIVLACFTDGLNCYQLRTSRPVSQPLSDPCRLAALSYDGRAILTAGLLSSVTLRDRKGRVLGEQKLEAPAVALSLSALAEQMIIGTAAGLVAAFNWR